MAEYTREQIKQMARAGAKADGDSAIQPGDTTAVRDILAGRADIYARPFVKAVLAERARIDAERTPVKPLLTEWRHWQNAEGETEFGVMARWIVGEEGPGRHVMQAEAGLWHVFSTAEPFNDNTHAEGTSKSGLDEAMRLADAAARQWFTLPEDAERTPTPSVEECMRALDIEGSSLARPALLRAFLSALPDDARRAGMAAVKGGK